MKRLLFIHLLILIFTANAMANVMSTACSYGTTPAAVEAVSMDHNAEHENHSTFMMSEQMFSEGCSGVDCGSVSDHKCGDCQFHCSGSALLPEASNVQMVESFTTYLFSMPFLLSVDRQRLLRPPRLS